MTTTAPALPIIHPAVLTSHDASRSLRSPLCPACGGEKRPYKTFCGGCWHRLRGLSREAALALFTGTVGEKYLVAVRTALGWLGVRTFTMPREKRTTALPVK